MDVLKLNSTNSYGVRGCHPVLTDVELPPWLPSDIVKQMIKRYECHAVTELRDLKPVHAATGHSHNRTPSGQSDSNLTDSSAGYSVDHWGHGEELDYKRSYDETSPV